jgi:hypothetical protein
MLAVTASTGSHGLDSTPIGSNKGSVISVDILKAPDSPG